MDRSSAGPAPGPGGGAGGGAGALPPDLRLLKHLVTGLTAVLVIGLITIIALLVIRLPAALEPPLPLPETILLPQGARPYAVTQGRSWVAVITDDDRILIYDPRSGALMQETRIAR